MENTKELKIGDKVFYKDDKDKTEYTIYSIYSDTKLSLGLKDYPDTEQDYQIDISEVRK